MAEAEWIITFEDGPLRTDVEFDELDTPTDDEWLDPLRRILDTLEAYPDGPIPAVFFLRGPGYPWTENKRPSPSLFRQGVDMILASGRHHTAIHCFAHDPDLWWGWPLRGPEIREDLERCVEYFTPMLPKPMTAFRPPFGQGGPPGVAWANEKRIRHHRWDIDTDDWLHHPDAGLLRSFKDDPVGHLAHILRSLPSKMWLHALWPGANDVLLHVSQRTADSLPKILDQMCEVTRRLNLEPKFVVPAEYVQIN